MADKKVIENFRGEIPRVTDEDLPRSGASLAINTRLTNGNIRPYPPITDSDDTNSTLSSVVTGGFTNIFKASPESLINWLSWTEDQNVSIMEVRYSDINRYDFPLEPTIEPQGGVLNVTFSGQYVQNKGADEWVSARTYYRRGNVAPPVPISNTLMEITASLIGGGTITSYSWERLTGDATIIPNPGSPGVSSDASPNFELANLEWPVGTGLGNANVKTARWRCTIQDDQGNTGSKEIQLTFTAYWDLTGSYNNRGIDGPGNDDGIYEWDEF